MSPTEAGLGRVRLEVVICTFNNAAGLAETLERLGRQADAPAGAWRVSVIDNASTDETPAVVARAAADFPAPLRRIAEPRQGLTWARLRGVRETDGEWIAFVDDDNLVDPGWVAAMIAATTSLPERAGAVGGRVRLAWDREPPHAAHEFGFCFAAQDHGEALREVENLVGAGMTLRRAALEASGWIAEPLLPDRIGRRLVSGGDVELGLRVRAAGYGLWYTPAASMIHRQAAGRASRRYLMRITGALGATAAIVALLGWGGDYAGWRAAQRGVADAKVREAARGLVWAVTRRRGLTAAAGWLSLALGHWLGVRGVEAMPRAERARIMGRAAIRPAVGS